MPVGFSTQDEAVDVTASWNYDVTALSKKIQEGVGKENKLTIFKVKPIPASFLSINQHF